MAAAAAAANAATIAALQATIQQQQQQQQQDAQQLQLLQQQVQQLVQQQAAAAPQAAPPVAAGLVGDPAVTAALLASFRRQGVPPPDKFKGTIGMESHRWIHDTNNYFRAAGISTDSESSMWQLSSSAIARIPGGRRSRTSLPTTPRRSTLGTSLLLP